MPSYTAKTRNVGRRPRSKRLRELGGTVTINNGGQPDLSPYELLSNKVTEVDQNSTDEQYPTAKLLYNLYAALGALIDALDEGKQDVISDLAAIRSGAALGATALQAITAAAGSDIGTVGTPSVTVSTQGSNTTLTFHQLKGAKGDKGDTGATGPQGPAGAGATVDSALSSTSTNPVQNKVVNSALAGKIPNTNAGINAAINLLTTGSSTPVDNDYYISQYVNGGSTTTSYHRRPMSALWAYIQGKLQTSLLLPFLHNNEINFDRGPQTRVWFNYRNAATDAFSNVGTINYFFGDYNGTTHSILNADAINVTGGIISDQAITANKSVVEINAVCTAASGSNVKAYGLKVSLSPTQHGLGTDSAAIYASATAGYAGMFSGGVKVSATLTANSVSATTVYQTSDDRLKDYLGDFHFNLADIERIPLRFFAFKADKERRVLLGTSAQAVQKVLPEIVGSSRTASEEDTEEYLSVDYSKLALVALDCVRQLRDEVAALRREVEQLKKERRR